MEKFMLGCRYNFTENVKEKVTLKVFFKNLFHSIGC